MWSHKITRLIERAWFEITEISEWQVVDETVNSGGEVKTKRKYFPTLTGIKEWMKLIDWDSFVITKEDFLRYLFLYHQAYKAELRKL